MDYNALREKYNAEEVGDRLIAVVNGQRQYIANKEPGGGFSLTVHGLMLEEQSAAAEVEDKPAKPARKKKEAPVEDDLLAGLDAE